MAGQLATSNSAILIVLPLESIAETQPQLHPALLRLSAITSQFFIRFRAIALMRRLHPRSPYQKLGGYVHLPRLIDKARLHRKGLLDGYNYKTVGFDKHLLAFLKIDGEAFEEITNKLDDDQAILAWVQKNGEQHSSEAIEQWNEAMSLLACAMASLIERVECPTLNPLSHNRYRIWFTISFTCGETSARC